MSDRNTHIPALSASEIASAIDWWRDAGVDCEFNDDVTDWLGESDVESGADAPKVQPKQAERDTPLAPPEKISLFAGERPADLPSFTEWWLTAPGLDAIGPRGRVAPRGNPGADLMILVTDPEESDDETLLSGAQGRLLARMLKAMEIGENRVYIASALPRFTPMADGQTMLQAGYAEVLEHHVALVAPRRVLAFGANILPLLGHDMAQDSRSLRELNHETGSIPLMVAEGLESMMGMPRLKANFWRRWLDWTAN